MKTLRWITFIPVAAAIAVLLGEVWGGVFAEASFSQKHIWASVLGVTPLFLGRCLPVAVFVVLGAAIAPKRELLQIAILGLIGGVAGWPLGAAYTDVRHGLIFYVVEGAGTLLGVSGGMLFALKFFRDRRGPE